MSLDRRALWVPGLPADTRTVFSLTTLSTDTRSITTAAVIALMISGMVGAPAAAQSLGADGQQDLNFGQIWAGAPTSVTRFDISQAGQFVIRGTRGTEVLVQLTLPPAMTSARGTQLPLEFGPNDGGYFWLPISWWAQSFDPRVPLTTTLGITGRLYMYLGGTARPSAQQQAGRYTGTITLTVSYTGN